jgi:hypothetical protein
MVINLKSKKMKTIVRIKTIGVLISVTVLAITGSCSKERIEPDDSRAEYQQMDNYYDTKKQKEQEFKIEGSGEGPIIGNQGTKIWISKEKLMYANGDSVHWPFTIKLVELYTPKDMIYYQMPTVSDGMLLTTGGEVRVRAFKGEVELVLRPAETWTVEMPNKNPESEMKIFYGVETSSFVDWTANPAGSFDATAYGYTGEIKKMGWVNCGKDAYSSVTTTRYSFTSSTDNLDKVSTFIYLPNQKGLMQAYNQTSAALPIGEEMKIIMIAINDSSQLFSYYKEIEVSSINQVDVTLTKISDADLTTILDGL